MGKREIRPLATPKPLNRSSQKVAHVIMSWISTDKQNLVTIPPRVSFPRMREIAHQNVCSACFFFFFFFFFPGSSNAPKPRPVNYFHAKYVKWRGSAQGCAFSRLENKNLTFKPLYSRKTAILGPILMEQKIFVRKLLYNGGCFM